MLCVWQIVNITWRDVATPDASVRSYERVRMLNAEFKQLFVFLTVDVEQSFHTERRA